MEKNKDMEFAEKVKFMRKTLNLTQMELSQKLNVSFATVNRWENKAFKPSALARKVINDFCRKSNIVF